MEFDLAVVVPLLLPRCSFFFVFGDGISYFVGFLHHPVLDHPEGSCNFGALAGGGEHTSFFSHNLEPE